MSASAESTETITNLHPPVPPRFPLRKLAHVAYAMSVTVGALGQVLFLGERFGGRPIGWVAAAGLAAFAEVCMVACGDWSLEHRTRGGERHRRSRSWLGLLALGIAVSSYAALLNASHWWPTSRSLALMFAGASMIGFLLHVLNGHILVSAYLAELAEYRSSTTVRQAAAALATSTEPDTPDPGTQSGTAADTGASTGLRLVPSRTGTGRSPQVIPSTEWDPELWEKAVRTVRAYRDETGTDMTVSELRERLSIGRNRALALRRDVLETGLGTRASTGTGAGGTGDRDDAIAGTESPSGPVPAYAR